MILSYTFRLGSTSAPLSHRPVSVTRCLQRGLSSTGERIRLAQSMNFASHTHRPRGDRYGTREAGPSSQSNHAKPPHRFSWPEPGDAFARLALRIEI